MTVLEVSVDGRQAGDMLDRLELNLRDRGQLLALVDTLIDAQRARFRGERVRWKRLAPATLRKHQRAGVGPQPLILTGFLRDSLTKRNPRLRVELRGQTLRFGTRVFYAEFHQRGKGVPRRTVVGVTKEQKAEVENKLLAFLMDGVG